LQDSSQQAEDVRLLLMIDRKQVKGLDRILKFPCIIDASNSTVSTL
jgi:hypothetical protein